MKPWAAARLRGAGLQRARLRRVVRQRGVAPGRPGRLRARAGCAWTTCATRRATSSGPLRRRRGRRQGEPGRLVRRRRDRSTSRVLRDRVMLPDGSLRPWTSPAGSRCGSPPRCRGSRGATSLRAGAQRAHAGLRGQPRRPRTSSPSGSPSSRSSPASTRRARRAAYYAPPGVDPDADLHAPGSPRSTPASPTAPRSAPSPTSSPRITPPTDPATTRARPRPSADRQRCWTDDIDVLAAVDEAAGAT